MINPDLPVPDSSHTHTDIEETIPRLSEQERAMLRAAASAALTDKRTTACPHCAHPCPEDELICPWCDKVLLPAPTTKTFPQVPLPASRPRQSPVGQVFVGKRQSIAFQINGQSLTLPNAESLIVGRSSGGVADVQPDVSLNTFQAEERGVSRHHLRLRRMGDVVYVTDLGSTNGTFLNSRPLAPHATAILRSGDELRLGRMTLEVVFTPASRLEQILQAQEKADEWKRWNSARNPGR